MTTEDTTTTTTEHVTTTETTTSNEPVCENGHTNNWRETFVNGLEEILHCRCGAAPVTVQHEASKAESAQSQPFSQHGSHIADPTIVSNEPQHDGMTEANTPI